MKYHLKFLVKPHYGAKNKLHQSIIDLMTAEDRELIPSNAVEAYKQNMLDKINSINKQFPRCSPVKASWYSLHLQTEEHHLHFHEVIICTFHLYKIKTEI